MRRSRTPTSSSELAASHPDQVAVGLDARGRDVAIRGWKQSSGADLIALAQQFDIPGVGALVVTDISRDGMLGGPAFEQLETVLSAVAIPVVASGGVASLDDLRTLAALEVNGRRLTGAIVGHRDLRAPVQRGGRDRRVLGTRVIPCLDVDAGRVVKGVNFVGIRDAGDPVELAARYDAEGADELVFLDITASSDARDTMVPRRRGSCRPSVHPVHRRRGCARRWKTYAACCARAPTRCRSTPRP